MKDIFRLVQLTETVSLKSRIVLNFYSFLFDKDELSFFEKYGQPEEEIEHMLSTLAKQMMDEYILCGAKLNMDVSKENLANIQGEIDIIVEHGKNICRRKQLSSSSNHDGQIIAQQQLQAQTEKQTEKEMELNYNEVHEIIKWPLRWGKTDLPIHSLSSKSYMMNRMFFRRFHSLERIATYIDPSKGWSFSKEIWLSYNFNYTCNAEKSLFSPFKKPAYFILGSLNGDDLHYVIITQTDARNLRDYWEVQPDTYPENAWIETLSGVLYAGTKISDDRMLEKSEELRQQIHFFNADLPYLVSSFSKCHWLRENAKLKLKFLQDHILAFHPSKASLLAHLSRLAEKVDNVPVFLPSKPGRLMRLLSYVSDKLFKRRRSDEQEQTLERPSKRARVIEPSNLIEYMDKFIPPLEANVAPPIGSHKRKRLNEEAEDLSAKRDKKERVSPRI